MARDDSREVTVLWCGYREIALPGPHSTETKNNHKWLFLLSLVRVQGVGPWSHPWEGYIIAVIRYPRRPYYITSL